MSKKVWFLVPDAIFRWEIDKLKTFVENRKVGTKLDLTVIGFDNISPIHDFMMIGTQNM